MDFSVRVYNFSHFFPFHKDFQSSIQQYLNERDDFCCIKMTCQYLHNWVMTNSYKNRCRICIWLTWSGLPVAGEWTSLALTIMSSAMLATRDACFNVTSGTPPTTMYASPIVSTYVHRLILIGIDRYIDWYIDWYWSVSGLIWRNQSIAFYYFIFFS